MQAALQRGLFRNPSAGEGAPPCSDTAAVLATAAEIADAMAYLHAKHIVHGDLSCSNVLLTSSTTAPHGFTAKVGLDPWLVSSCVVVLCACWLHGMDDSQCRTPWLVL